MCCSALSRGLATLLCLHFFILVVFLPSVLCCLLTRSFFHLFFCQIKDGVRLFEISDVVLRDDSSDTGAKNCRRLVATYMGPTAGFEVIHGLVDRIMSLVQVCIMRSHSGNLYIFICISRSRVVLSSVADNSVVIVWREF